MERKIEKIMGPSREEINQSLSKELSAANLDSETETLVRSFAAQLAAKLARAKDKHGFTNEWMADDWEDKCRADLLAHIEKGDPLDVAAYCAFMAYHGWRTNNI